MSHYVKRTDTAVLELTAKKRFSDSPPVKLFFPFPSFVQSQKVSSAGQRYTYRVLQTIQMKLILLCVWAERAILGTAKTALKFKYEF
jgi:hypothetical protein